MKNLTAALLCAALICSMTSSASADTVGFQGAFAPANWSSTETTSDPFDTSSSVNTAGAPASIAMAADADFGDSVTRNFTIAAPTSATISFDFDYSENDDFGSGITANAGVLVNGVFTEVATTNGHSGSYSFDVTTGDVFGFRLNLTSGGWPVDADFNISNFKSSNPVPEPASLLLLLVAGSAALVADRRRRRRLQKQA